jgi:hypothetical protein
MPTFARPARPAHATRSRRLAGALAGAAIGLLAVTPVFAVTPEGSVTVETNGCDFTIHIDLDVASPVIAWEVKKYASDWKDGKTVLEDSVSGDADGKVVAGPYTLPAGHYNVAVDDEPVDSSAIVEDFTLTCEAATSSPSEQPTESASEQPVETESSSPSGEELPVAATPKPTGEELGVVGVGNVTPPPTDTSASTSGASAAAPSSLVAFAVIGLIASVLFVASNRRLSAIRATEDRSRRR